MVISVLLWRLQGRAGESRAMRWGLSLILGGAFGNLYDRVDPWHVTDFLEFYYTASAGRHSMWPTARSRSERASCCWICCALGALPKRHKMFPQVFHIGTFFLPTYGLLVASAFLVGLWIVNRLVKRTPLNADAVMNLGIYTAIAGMVGAKLMMILLDAGYYFHNPGEFFSFSTLQAGGIFYGGLVLSLITPCSTCGASACRAWP